MSWQTVYRDPINRTFTDDEMALMSDLFRVFAREVTSEDDKKYIAPSEIGINYETGELFIRDPHTGNLLSPNSLPNIDKLMRKFDTKGRLNADMVSGIMVYRDLSELSRFSGAMTPDNVIALGMTYTPSILIATVQSSTELEWPTENGIVFIYKYDEEVVCAHLYDRDTYAHWVGHYDYKTHQFRGWTTDNSYGPYVEVEGGANIVATVTVEPQDLVTAIIVRVINGLDAGAQVILNERDPVPLVEPDGRPLSYEIAENNTIMLLYDEPNNRWVLRDAGESASLAAVDMLRRRVTTYHQDVLDLAESTTTRFADVNNRIDLIDNTLENFDAALVKSINGSKLSMDVIPSGAIERLFRVTNIAIMADSSSVGYPKDAQNGDTIQDITSSKMYFITNEEVLGTPNYMDGLNVYTAGGATSVDWANVQHKPTTLAGYGITDAASKSGLENLDEQVNGNGGLAERLAAAETTITNLVNIIGSYADTRSVATRLDSIEDSIASILNNPGNIDLVITNYTALNDGESGVTTITGFNGTYDKLFVNYGQTILKLGIDYSIVNNGVSFARLTLNAGDVVQFIIFKQKTS